MNGSSTNNIKFRRNKLVLIGNEQGTCQFYMPASCHFSFTGFLFMFGFTCLLLSTFPNGLNHAVEQNLILNDIAIEIGKKCSIILLALMV